MYTVEYFLKEYQAFRGIMCSTAYDIDQKLRAFGGLTTVYLNVDTADQDESERLKTRMTALKYELDTRLAYEMKKNIKEMYGLEL